MTKLEFLDTLRRRLVGMPQAEIDDVIADYATHFADGMAAVREIMTEVLRDYGYRVWEAGDGPDALALWAISVHGEELVQ